MIHLISFLHRKLHAYTFPKKGIIAGCSLASVKGKTQKKRKREDDSDEAEAFSDSGSDIGESLSACNISACCC